MLFRSGCKSEIVHFEDEVQQSHKTFFRTSKPLTDRGQFSSYDSFVFVEEAPYIVLACGLDPSVATIKDVDRRDA